ncbi:hypothetical protein ABZP36_013628 [Zizania latifolia]
MMSIVVLLGLVIAGIYWGVNKFVIDKPAAQIVMRKKKTTVAAEEAPAARKECYRVFYTTYDFKAYSAAIDIWSIGCIFAEILTGKPLCPGKNVLHQLDLMTDLLGTPSIDTVTRDIGVKDNRFCYRYVVVFQYGSAVLFNIADHEAEYYLDIIRKHASGWLPDMRKDG